MYATHWVLRARTSRGSRCSSLTDFIVWHTCSLVFCLKKDHRQYVDVRQNSRVKTCSTATAMFHTCRLAPRTWLLSYTRPRDFMLRKSDVDEAGGGNKPEDVSSTAGVSKSKHDQVGAHTQDKFSNRAIIGCDVCPRSNTSRELTRQAHSTCRGHIPIKPCQLCSRNKTRMTATEGRLKQMQTS
jgi:hypothetical protein